MMVSPMRAQTKTANSPTDRILQTEPTSSELWEIKKAIVELDRKIDAQKQELEKKLMQNQFDMKEEFAALRLEMRDMHIDSIKQMNTVVWKTVGLLSAVGALVKYFLL